MTEISKILNMLHNFINKFDFKHSNRFSQEFFTRINSKMSFFDLILFILSLPRATFQSEINNFLTFFKKWNQWQNNQFLKQE